MSPWQENAEQRALVFAVERERELKRRLGAGYDGVVFESDRLTAIKSLRYSELYQRERDIYLRLFDRGMSEACGCRIPRLVDYSDRLSVVEMEIVQPPFVLDFAGAYLDRRPDFPEDVYAEWQAEKAEQFGEDWPLVQSIMAVLAGIGIYLADVKPGNITLR
jgi:hypothetical protein